MIQFHIERNIRFRDLFSIFLRKQNLNASIKKIYTEKIITTTNYGRTALELILDKYNIHDCKIMIPAFICSVFYDIFKRRNITPVLIDVDMKTWNITSETLKKNFDKSARCLITNNMNGLPCETEKIKKILTKNQILIEDCAHSLGAKHKGHLVGLEGDAAFFSLYKNLPSISGGFTLTAEPLLQTKLKRERITFNTVIKLIYFTGKIANLYKEFKNDTDLYDEDLVYEKVKTLAPNKITERIASFYLKKIYKIINARRKIAFILKENLRNDLTFQEDKLNEHVYTYFSFLLGKDIAEKRNEFLKLLRKQGIVGRIVWNKPLLLNYKNQINKCRNAKEISERIVGIPINPNYSEEEWVILSNKIKKALLQLNN